MLFFCKWVYIQIVYAFAYTNHYKYVLIFSLNGRLIECIIAYINPWSKQTILAIWFLLAFQSSWLYHHGEHCRGCTP